MEEDLPNERERSAVEIYSKSLGTWIPGSVTAIVNDRDVVVHYSVAGARAGAQGVRTKRVDAFDGELMRSILTGAAFSWRPGGLYGPGRADEFLEDRGPYVDGTTTDIHAPAAAAGRPPLDLRQPADSRGCTTYPKEGDTVEVYSKSLQTWVPATVTAVVDARDVVVHYSVTGAREGASGFRTKRIDIFEADLIRDITTGMCFEPAPASKPSAAEKFEEEDGFDALAARASGI